MGSLCTSYKYIIHKNTQKSIEIHKNTQKRKKTEPIRIKGAPGSFSKEMKKTKCWKCKSQQMAFVIVGVK
nr:MAG TPA: hypothetical protein [Caudoviricetes sp.]